MSGLLIAAVRLYRASVSPFLGQRCRYYPSCSAYAATAISVHGPVKGSALAAWRLARCHPWCKGGVDLVPGSPMAEQLRLEGLGSHGL